jgi:hypothetical protein
MTELEELRAYMQENYKGLRADRSTESYALEFLKTGDKNLALASSKVHLSILVDDTKQALARMEYLLPKTIEIARRIEEMELRNGSANTHNSGLPAATNSSAGD